MHKALLKFIIRPLGTLIVSCLLMNTASAQAPVITVQPVAAKTYAEGAILGTTDIRVTATGAGLTYQWKKDGVIIPGSNNFWYSKSALELSDAGSYTCIVSNPAGSLETTACVVTITPATGVPKPNPTSLANKTVIEGGQFSVSVSYTGTDPRASTYVWTRNGQPIRGTVSGSSMAIGFVTKADEGPYVCVMSNSQGSYTATVTLTVTPTTLAPTFFTQPNSPVILLENTQLTLTSNTRNTSIFQWKKDGVNIAGANGDTYTKLATLADAGIYTLEISNSTGQKATSNPITVVVDPAIPPIITRDLNDTIVDEAGPFSLTAEAKGGLVSFSWTKDGSPIVAPLSVTNSASASSVSDAFGMSFKDTGTYVCSACNAIGCVNFKTIKVSMRRELLPLFIDLANEYKQSSGNVVLKVKGEKSELLTKWFIDKKPLAISGINYNFSLSQAKGKHEVRVTSDDGKLVLEKTVEIK